MPKSSIVRRIDLPPPAQYGRSTPENPVKDISPPALPAIDVPENLMLSAVLDRSDRSATTIVSAVWEQPRGSTPQGFLFQIAENSSFTTNPIARATNVPSIAIAGLKPNTTYYARVATSYHSLRSDWTDTESIVTPQDTSPPAPPTSLTAAFQNDGSCLIRCTPPASDNYRRIVYTVQGNGVTRTLYTSDGTTVYTLGMNQADSVGSFSASLTITARSESWAGVQSTTINTTAVKAKPADVAGVITDFTGRDCIFGWTSIADATRYVLTIDSQANTVSTNQYRYRFAENQQEHSGVGDPSLAWSIVAVDALGQSSNAATTGTATNAVPTAPTGTLTLSGVSEVVATVTSSPPADFNAYIVRFYRNSVLVATQQGATDTFTYSPATGGLATYTADIRTLDAFLQLSTATALGPLTVDVLTISEIRADAIYSDSLGTGPAFLYSILADNLTGSGPTYTAASAGTAAWTNFERPIVKSYRRITLAGSVTNNPSFYIRIDPDGTGTSYRYFAGVTGDNYTLVERASQALAESNAVPMSTTPYGFFHLPQETLARYVRVYHWNASGSYRLDEFYPRVLIRGDDIQAETISALQIAAGAVTATKINVAQLSAITADMGSLTAGTITGGTIQTATSGARIVLDTANGIRGFNSSNVLQAQLASSDGSLQWATGIGKANASGIFIESGGTLTDSRYFRFTESGNHIGGTAALVDSTTSYMGIYGERSGKNNQLLARALSDLTHESYSEIGAIRSDGVSIFSQVAVSAQNNSTTQSIDMTGAPVHVGTTTGGASGDIRASGNLSIGGNPFGAAQIEVLGTGTGATAGLNVRNSSGASAFQVLHNGNCTASGVLRGSGGITTNGSDVWTLGDYTPGSVSQVGYVTVVIDGTSRRLLVG